MSDILVEKADGTREAFRVEKLRQSLKKAGASGHEINSIVQRIEKTLYDGIKTETIYREAFSILKEDEKMSATKYSLRRALFNLGPTGFPFEDFLARLLEAEGYKTKVRVEMRGKCAPHELDVIAYKNNECLIAEAKFHARQGIKSDLQVVLYSYARFLDLKDKKLHESDTCGVTSLWIITNTKFTKTAIEYARCIGINLLSWQYPKKDNLQERIERSGLYPVTVLQSLSLKDKRSLLEQGTVLCQDIVDNRNILRSAGISSQKTSAAVDESVRLCAI